MQNDMLPSVSQNNQKLQPWLNVDVYKIGFFTPHATALNYNLYKTCCHSSQTPTLPSFWQQQFNKGKTIRDYNLNTAFKKKWIK